MSITKDKPRVIDTKEDVEKLIEYFQEENQEIFEMVGWRLHEYSEAGNYIFINWLSQALVNLLKDANENCMKKVLGVDESKMQ